MMKSSGFLSLLILMGCIVAKADEKSDSFTKDIFTALKSQGVYAHDISTSVDEDTLSRALFGSTILALLKKGSYEVRNITFHSGPLKFKCLASVTNSTQERQVNISMCKVTSKKLEGDMLIPTTTVH